MVDWKRTFLFKPGLYATTKITQIDDRQIRYSEVDLVNGKLRLEIKRTNDQTSSSRPEANGA